MVRLGNDQTGNFAASESNLEFSLPNYNKQNRTKFIHEDLNRKVKDSFPIGA